MSANTRSLENDRYAPSEVRDDARAPASVPADAPPRGSAGRALAALVSAGDGTAAVVLRLTLALVFFPHGAQKLLGWFGGFGFEGTMGHLTQAVGLPAAVALLVIGIEFFAPLALAAGFLTRAAALGIGAVMVGAIVTTHLPHGFFMNWTGMQAGEGFEYHLLVLGMVAALLVAGAGRWSVDRALTRKLRAGGRPELHAA